MPGEVPPARSLTWAGGSSPTSGSARDTRCARREAPDVFGFDEDADQVVVLQEHPDESLRPQVASAVKYCPAMALAIEEE